MTRESIVQVPERPWPQTDKVWQQFVQFDRMMERTGVNPVTAVRENQGESMARARDICLQCLAHRECRNWLLGTEGMRQPPEFCPNADFFRRWGHKAPQPMR